MAKVNQKEVKNDKAPGSAVDTTKGMHKMGWWVCKSNFNSTTSFPEGQKGKGQGDHAKGFMYLSRSIY